MKVVAVSDSSGGIYDKKGLRIEPRQRRQGEEGHRHGRARREDLERGAARAAGRHPRSGRARGRHHARERARASRRRSSPRPPTARRLRTPTTSSARNGVVVIPDILANAGGVTVSYFEWVQDLYSFFWDPDMVRTQLERTDPPRLRGRRRDRAPPRHGPAHRRAHPRRRPRRGGDAAEGALPVGRPLPPRGGPGGQRGRGTSPAPTAFRVTPDRRRSGSPGPARRRAPRSAKAAPRAGTSPPGRPRGPGPRGAPRRCRAGPGAPEGPPSPRGRSRRRRCRRGSSHAPPGAAPRAATARRVPPLRNRTRVTPRAMRGSSSGADLADPRQRDDPRRTDVGRQHGLADRLSVREDVARRVGVRAAMRAHREAGRAPRAPPRPGCRSRAS